MMLVRIDWPNFMHFSIQLCFVVITMPVGLSKWQNIIKAGDTEKKRRSLPLDIGSLNSARGLWAPPAGSGAEPQSKSNLVHCIFKIWQLVATILIILVRLFIVEQYRNLKMKKSRGGNCLRSNCLLLPQCSYAYASVNSTCERWIQFSYLQWRRQLFVISYQPGA